jgi:PEP-CTERM motif
LKYASLFLVVCLLLPLSTSLFAATICTANPCQQGGSTDSIDWGSQGLGTPGTLWSTPQNWKSTSGQYTGQIGVIGPTDFKLMQQGTNWNGNFSNGEYLIWNQVYGSDNAITVWLTAGVPDINWEVVQIQPLLDGPFTATACEWDGSCFTENGVSNSNGDGSAIYIGIANASDITALGFTVTDAEGKNNAAIGTVYFGWGVGVSPVPEPNSLILLGSGVMGMLAYGRRRLSR